MTMLGDGTQLRDGHPATRIGPNAIIRMAEAIDATEGRNVTARVFSAAGLDQYLEQPPQDMVPEGEVNRLHGTLPDLVGHARAQSIGWIAGQRTADYLLAHRIPVKVQRVLKVLPAPLAAAVLVKAIAKNSWTFVGSGQLSVSGWHPVVLTVSHCPLCHGRHAAGTSCSYYAAVFERLFATLVHASARAIETSCSAVGGTMCTFEIRWH